VIVVTRSSNPEGRSLQQAVMASGVSIEESLLADIAALNASADIPRGTVGAVVGATLAPAIFSIIPARGHNSGPWPGRPGCTALRRGGAIRRLPSRRRGGKFLAFPLGGGTRPIAFTKGGH
jgi:hypothetical protein